MRVKISTRTKSYAIYVYDYDDDEFVERAIRIFARFEPAWVQEVYDGRHKKIIILRYVA
jgi:CRISPR/Cas system-associated endoribonuclease Cas2